MKAVTLGDRLAGEISDQIAIPLAGRISSPEFTVSLIAEDDLGASDPASVTLSWGGATKDQDKVRLLVLAVGVSDYANDPPRDLAYAAKDADDIVSQLLRQKERGLYQDVKVRLLTDKEASKIDILDGLKWLYDEARPGDVAIVYFAGHGRDEPTGGGLVFHYLPHEVQIGSTARRQATAVSKDVLLDELTAIYQKGTKVLTFLDTCYAGAVGDTGDEDVRCLTEFAKEHRLSASQFTALGAFRDCVLGYFDWEKKDYTRIPIQEQVEVLALVGDIALNDGEPKLHPHVVVGKADGTAHGGASARGPRAPDA
jgi:hypothetical protein